MKSYGLRTGDPAESRARVGRWLLAVAVLGSALALGSVHTPVLAVCSVLSAVATALIWWDAEPFEPRSAATTLVTVALVLIGWTVLQAIPLPKNLLAAIASENADVWARCLSPLRASGPDFTPISLDPSATRVQILRGVTYLVVFAGALRVAQRQPGVAFLERTLVVSAVALAFGALLHPALGAHKVFGLYEPTEVHAYDPHHLAPLLNTNHLAAYVNIGLFVAFGCVIDRRDSLPRPVALAVVLLLSATTIWTASRGGSATLFLGSLLVAMLALGARRTRLRDIAAPVALVTVGVCGAAMVLLSAFDATRLKFVHNDLFKLGLTKNALELLTSFGTFGMGRGAFESVFAKIRGGTEYVVYTHPENVVAQWTTEWGLPVAIGAMFAIGWSLRPRTPLARSRPPAGAWGALIAVALHNLVDYSSELPGAVIALVLCAAIVVGGTGSGKAKVPRGAFWARRPRHVVVGLLGATAFALAVTVPFAGHELYNEERAFRDIGLDPTITRAEFHERARETMLRHPAEAYFPFVGAVRATVAKDESVLPWAARALERSPVYGRVHLLLARTLFVKNPSQARLEYRIACLQDGHVCALDEALRLVGSYEEAMELVPDGPRGPIVLASLAEALGPRLPSSAVRLDAELSQRDPTAFGPVRRAAADALADVMAQEAWCDLEAGIAAAKRLRAAAPDKCEGHALAAELEVAAGETDVGFTELEGSVDQVADRSLCGRRLVLLAVQTRNRARVDAALERLIKLGCEAHTECVDNLTFAAQVESERGGERRALVLTRKAWERAPEREDLLVAIARKAEGQGFHGEALRAYTQLSERHPGTQTWQADVARETQAVARGLSDWR
jgi:hypothetical protein